MSSFHRLNLLFLLIKVENISEYDTGMILCLCSTLKKTLLCKFILPEQFPK